MEAKSAAQRANRLSITDLGGSTWTGASYDWDTNEITIHVGVADFASAISHENCNYVRRLFIATLASWPTAFTENNEFIVREFLGYTIDRWFSHEGFQNTEAR